MYTDKFNYIIKIIFILIFFLGLNNKTEFSSYEEAQTWVITNPNFTKDTVDTTKSSWIREAEYYTDGSYSGYLILNMRGKEYIWEGVPLNVWEGIKQADSFGKYYHKHIKGRFILELDN